MTAVSGLLVRMKQMPWEQQQRRDWCYFSCVTMETVWRISTKLLWPSCLLRAPLPFPWTRRHSGKTQCMLGWRGTWPNPPGPSGKGRPRLKTEGGGGRGQTRVCFNRKPAKVKNKHTNKPTDGYATVWPHQVNVGLGDGSHTDLVIGSGQERGKRAGECDRAIACGTANGNTDLQWTERTVSVKPVLPTVKSMRSING